MNKKRITISITQGIAFILLLIVGNGTTSILFSTTLAESASLGEPIFVEKRADSIQKEIGPNMTH